MAGVPAPPAIGPLRPTPGRNGSGAPAARDRRRRRLDRAPGWRRGRALVRRMGLRREPAHRLILDTLWEDRRLVGSLLLVSLLAALSEGIGLGLIVPFLDNLMNPEGVAMTSGIGWVDRYVLGAGATQEQQLFRFGAFILGATWLRSALSYHTRVLSARTLTTLLHRLRCQAFDQLQSVALRYFSDTRSGNIINTLTTEGQRLFFFFGIVIHLVVLGFMLAVYVGLLWWLSWSLTLGAILLFGLLSLGLSRLIRRIRRHGDAVTAANARLTSTIDELVSGIRTVIASGTQAFEVERLTAASGEVAHQEVETRRRAALVLPLSEALAGTILVVTVVVAVQVLVAGGAMSLAALLTFLFVLFRLMPVVQQLNDARGNMASTRGALQEFVELLRRDDKPYLENGTRPLAEFRDAIVFEDVSFAYGDEPVLEQISLTIPRGSTVAIVGGSGAGKSTLADLIPRFHDPQSGRILIDGVDLRELQVETLRKHIAVVSQSTFIFNDTVRANIAYGVPDAADEAIHDAARLANALPFIESMPLGFDTVLGDQGVRLSGGQRQRVAIARALLRDPEILILDEATSALDSATERLVHQSLERLMRGRTVVVIAHRLSTVEHADWLVVIEHGRVVEQGSYGDLIASRGRLWQYHEIQFQLA